MIRICQSVCNTVSSVCLVLTSSAFAASPCDPATNKQLVEDARSALEDLSGLYDLIRRLGYNPPGPLKTATDGLIKAISLGIDVGEAAGQVDYQVQKIVANRREICAGQEDADVRSICESKIDRQMQATAVNAVLGLNNAGSLLRRVAAKWSGSKCQSDDRAECKGMVDKLTQIGNSCIANPNRCMDGSALRDVNSLREMLVRKKCPGFQL